MMEENENRARFLTTLAVFVLAAGLAVLLLRDGFFGGCYPVFAGGTAGNAQDYLAICASLVRKVADKDLTFWDACLGPGGNLFRYDLANPVTIALVVFGSVKGIASMPMVLSWVLAVLTVLTAVMAYFWLSAFALPETAKGAGALAVAATALALVPRLSYPAMIFPALAMLLALAAERSVRKSRRWGLITFTVFAAFVCDIRFALVLMAAGFVYTLVRAFLVGGRTLPGRLNAIFGYLWSACLGVGVSAGISLPSLLARTETKLSVKGLLTAFLTLLKSGFGEVKGVLSGLIAGRAIFLIAAAVLCLAGLIVLIALSFRKAEKKTLGNILALVLALVVLVADAAAFAGGCRMVSTGYGSWGSLTGNTAVEEALAFISEKEQNGYFRIEKTFSASGGMDALVQHYHSVSLSSGALGRCLTAYAEKYWPDLMPKPGLGLFFAAGPENEDQVRLLGIRYILSKDPLTLPGATEEGRFGDLTLYRVDEASSIASFYRAETLTEDETYDAADQTMAVSVNWQDRDAESVVYVNDEKLGGTVQAAIACGGKGYLFLAVPYDAGWTAKVDGEKATLYKANEGFMALSLGEGTHTVLLEYVPAGLTLGGRISLGALIACLLIAALGNFLEHVLYLREVEAIRKKQGDGEEDDDYDSLMDAWERKH